MDKEKLQVDVLNKSLSAHILKQIREDNQSNIDFFIMFLTNFIADYFNNESFDDEEMSDLLHVCFDYFQNNFDIICSKEELNIIFHQLVIKHCDFVKDIQHLNAIFQKHNK